MVKKIILYILLIGLMLLIFYFSNKSANVSSKQSGRIVNIIINTMEKITNKNYNDLEREEIGEKISLPIRKLAHFILYFTLGIVLFLLLKQYNIDLRRIVIISLLCSILYACTDEFHQLFIPGRTGTIKDVSIDTAGAILGITICLKKSNKELNPRKNF